MLILNDRTALDTSLNDTTSTLLILVGKEESSAGAVHRLIESRKWDDWQRWFLITDISVLTDVEKNDWFKGNAADYYVVLGSANSPKTVAQQGSISDLLTSDGKPDYLKIRKAILVGDQQ